MFGLWSGVLRFEVVGFMVEGSGLKVFSLQSLLLVDEDLWEYPAGRSRDLGTVSRVGGWVSAWDLRAIRVAG